MPRIAEFFGIAIYMYFADVKGHHKPHLHALYGEFQASFAIEDGQLLAGSLPRKRAKRVRSWIEANQEALNDNWNRAISGGEPQWIGA